MKSRDAGRNSGSPIPAEPDVAMPRIDSPAFAPKPGDTAYIAAFNVDRNRHGDQFNAQRYEVAKVQVEAITGDEATIILNGKRTKIKLESLYGHRIEAEQARYRIAYDLLRRHTASELASGVLPPERLRPNQRVRLTGNPLRFGERNMAFGAQTNTWLAQQNAQKIVQMVGVVLTNIEMLFDIVDMLAMLNDYAKKLLGKQILVEFNSLYGLLAGTRDAKGLKDFNPAYRDAEFRSLKAATAVLAKKHGFFEVRHKLAAHMDSSLDMLDYTEKWSKLSRAALGECWNEFSKHVNAVMPKYYPMETKMYLRTRDGPVLDAFQIEHESGQYVPFHDFEM